jgi:hypothetical protein
MASCTHYELNMSGASFGDCKCGQSKAAHSNAAFHSAVAAVAGLHLEPSPKASAPVVTSGEQYFGPCEVYTLDMNAAKFGACRCGFAKTGK